MKRLKREISRLWHASPSLTLVGVGMLGVLTLTLGDLAADPRVVAGAPAWLKPAKFAISTSIYVFTVAWILTFLGAWPRFKRIVGGTIAVVLTLEVALIVVQAARGVSSHFNVGTPLDGIIFSVMGAAILILWIASIALTIAVFRQRFEERALGWAIRLGALIMVLGSGSGALMTSPTEAQMAAARAGQRMTVAGAHTVGAPDGGPGMPGTGWSSEHGDIRVPHFMGLHALQILPLIAVLFRRVTSAAASLRAVFLAAASYVSLFAILLTQALGGQSVLRPAGGTAAALILWLGATSVALTIVLMAGRRADNAMKAMVWR